MRLEQAHIAVKAVVGKPFCTLPQCTDLDMTDKGAVGKVLERIIGLRNSSSFRDFEDGELKTNYAKYDGAPRETMWIMNISDNIDALLDRVPFEDSRLFRKIRSVLYVPIYRDCPPREWTFLPPIHVNFDLPECSKLRQEIARDYEHILDQLISRVNSGADLYSHVSGHFIQIRPHDSQPYHPIFSYRVKRYISNKNHGFYFQKDFMIHLQSLSPDYPFRWRL